MYLAKAYFCCNCEWIGEQIGRTADQIGKPTDVCEVCQSSSIVMLSAWLNRETPDDDYSKIVRQLKVNYGSIDAEGNVTVIKPASEGSHEASLSTSLP